MTWELPVVGLLLMAPLAMVAGPVADIVDGTTVVEVPTLRAGDVMTWVHDIEYMDDGDVFVERANRWVVEVQEPTQAPDRYGVMQDVEPMRVDEYEDGELVESDLCFLTPGHNWVVRREIGLQDPRDFEGAFHTDIPGIVTPFEGENVPFVRYGGRCGPNLLRPEPGEYSEGDRIPVLQVGSSELGGGNDEETAMVQDLLLPPAKQTTFAGRPALQLHLDATFLLSQENQDNGTTAMVEGKLVDGIPAIVDYHVLIERKGTILSKENLNLVGFEPGSPDATALRPGLYQETPRVNPDGVFQQADRLLFDDEGFGFPFRFQDAWNATLQDPQSGLSEFLAANPDAFLRQTAYYREGRYDPTPAVETYGSWNIHVCNEIPECVSVRVVRLVPVEGGATVDRVDPINPLMEPLLVPLGGEPIVISSTAAVAIIDTAVPEIDPIQNILWGVWMGGPDDDTAHSGFYFSDVALGGTDSSDRSGYVGHFHLVSGGVSSYDKRNVDVQESGLPLLSNTDGEEVIGAAAPSPPLLDSPAGIASTVAATIGAAAILFWLSRIVVVSLFSRTVGPKLLQHPRRKRIVTAIEEEPGIHFRALQRATKIGRGNLDHHLRKLSEAGLISVQIGGSRTCFFPMGRIRAELMDAATHVRAEGPRKVLQAVLDEPGASMGDLGALTALTPSTITHHIRRLKRAGLVVTEREGRNIHADATSLGEEVMGVVA